MDNFTQTTILEPPQKGHLSSTVTFFRPHSNRSREVRLRFVHLNPRRNAVKVYRVFSHDVTAAI